VTIGVLTLIHQYIWYQRTPKTSTALIAPSKMTVWATRGGQRLTDTGLLASISVLKNRYGAGRIQLDLHYQGAVWYADAESATPVDSVITHFPFLKYWFHFTRDDTNGLGRLAQYIRQQELELQLVFSSNFERPLRKLRESLPHLPQIMPPSELKRVIRYRRWLLLPIFHTNYDVALVPMDTTRFRNELTQKFVRLMGHLGIPVWVDEPRNLSQLVWLEERHIKSVRMQRIDLALLPRTILLGPPSPPDAPLAAP